MKYQKEFRSGSNPFYRSLYRRNRTPKHYLLSNKEIITIMNTNKIVDTKILYKLL